MLNTPVKSDFEFGAPLSDQKLVKVDPTGTITFRETHMTRITLTSHLGMPLAANLMSLGTSLTAMESLRHPEFVITEGASFPS